MGLKKHETLPSGVQLNYHRIVSMNVVVGEQIIVEVASYTSQAKRREEQAALAQARETGDYPDVDVFVSTRYFNACYDPEMSIAGAYAYLKTLPEFEGAEDALDE